MKLPISLLLVLLCCSSTAFARKKTKPKPPEAPVVAETVSAPPDPFAKTDRIHLFESTVTVQQNGSLHVVENITIYNGDGDMGLDEFPMQYIEAGGNNNEIHRGIMRSFPTVYVNRYHFFQNTTFKLLDVKMNGAAVPYETEHSLNSNGYRVKIGDPDGELANGFYTYTLVYETEHQLKHFDNYDELAWNVTGNGWNFRIDSAVCTFVIPGNDSVFSNACYTGGQYEQGQDCSIFQHGMDTIRFTTTKALWPNQGITVASSWRKGVIARPGTLSQAWWMFTANIGALGMPLLLLLIFLYNLIQWWRYGRDLKPGTIYPRYMPPAGFSPAALGYIYFQGMKDKLVAATITDLALRHFFKIDVERTGTVFKGTVYAFLKSNETFVPVAYNDYHKEANGLLYTRIQRGEYNESLADLNTAIKSDLNQHYLSRRGQPGKGFFFKNTRYLAFGFLLAVPAFAGLMIWNLAHASLSPWPIVLLIVSFILVIVMQYIFFKLFPAYTPEGRKLMDELEGYRMYLKTVDEARLNTMNPPDKTIDLFEKNLPFAIALNCDIEWGNKFEGILAAAAIDDTTLPVRAFYMSDTGQGFTGSAFASGLSSSISSASTPPSSSSDSSSGSSSSFGGGSSGSGGGGGGGGGW